MKTLEGTGFAIDDRVGLKGGFFHDDQYNPWHSTTGTVGTLTRLARNGCIRVDWDNGNWNHYICDNLFLVEECIMDVEELFAEVVL